MGLVPFTMTGVRPVGLPAVPGLSNFHETNVRTYVHRAGRDPGVWFFSLDAANRTAVAIARAAFHLPYYHAQMSLAGDAEGVISYDIERLRPGPVARHVLRPMQARGGGRAGRPRHARALPGGTILPLCGAPRGRLYRGQVHHTPYPLQPAEVIGARRDAAGRGRDRTARRGPAGALCARCERRGLPLPQGGSSRAHAGRGRGRGSG